MSFCLIFYLVGFIYLIKYAFLTCFPRIFVMEQKLFGL